MLVGTGGTVAVGESHDSHLLRSFSIQS